MCCRWIPGKVGPGEDAGGDAGGDVGDAGDAGDAGGDADADAVHQEVGSDPLELGPSPLLPLHPRRPSPPGVQHLHRGQQLLAGGVKTVLLFSPLFFSHIFFR